MEASIRTACRWSRNCSFQTDRSTETEGNLWKAFATEERILRYWIFLNRGNLRGTRNRMTVDLNAPWPFKSKSVHYFRPLDGIAADRDVTTSAEVMQMLLCCATFSFNMAVRLIF